MGHVSGWKVLVLHSCGSVWKMIPKVIWPRKDWFWSFSLEYCFFFVDFISARTEICMVAQVCFSFDEIKSFRWLIWMVFWSNLEISPFFSAIGFSNVVWSAFSMQSIFTYYVSVSSSVSFVASNDEIFINSTANNIDRSSRFFMLTVCWCSTPFTAIVVLSKVIIEPFTGTSRRWVRWCRIFFGWRNLERTWTFWVAIMSWTWCSNFFLT